MELLEESQRAVYNKAEGSLAFFLQQAWPVIEPGTPYQHNWHIDCVAEHLQAVQRGEITRLIINQPPRSLKSLLVSVCWPAWCWALDPKLRWMFASYSASLAAYHSVLRRLLIQSDWYRHNWDKVCLTDDQNLKMEFANTHRGIMTATSVGGSAIGKGGDILVFDDPLNPTEAASPVMRENANRWIRQSFLTRLNDKHTGRIVGVMQRLHEQDTSGMLLAMGGWTHLCLPAEAERRTVVPFPGGRTKLRKPGDLLFPAREGRAELDRRKVELGSYGYAGQYQQRPSPAEGGMLKREWWRFWYPREMTPPAPITVRREDGSLRECPQCPLPDRFDESLLSWDMAFKGASGSDYVVGQYWARCAAEKYLIDQQRAQADFPTTLQMVLRMVARYPEADAVLVEDKANGPAVLQTLRREVGGLIPVTPAGGKESRVHAVAPAIEAGNVYLPHPSACAWVEPFIERAAAFPNAEHDDEIDAMSQALLRLKGHALPWPIEDLAPDEDAAWHALLERLGIPPDAQELHTGW